MNRVGSAGPIVYFPDPPSITLFTDYDAYCKNAELVTLGTLKTGLDPVEAFDSLRRVDAFGFVINHVGQRGLACRLVILVAAVGCV